MEIKYRIDLYKLLPPNPVTVELGVAEGYFSQHILQHWNPSLHYAVDFWGTLATTGDGAFEQAWHDANFESAMKKMKPFEEKLKVLRGVTWQVSDMVQDESVDIVYIDAGHSYEDVKRDLEAWIPKVKPGGVIAGHDFINPAYGVKQAAEEAAHRLGTKLNVIKEDKDEDAGFWMYKPK